MKKKDYNDTENMYMKPAQSTDRFKYKTRYFSDSGIIGTKEFVSTLYQQFKHYFYSTKEKQPKPISGLTGIYSLKKLTE